MKQNKLIAEFMGWSYYSDYGNHRDVYYEEAVIDPADPDFVMTPHWNDSWDWLMPVVEKIERLAGVTVIIKKSRCRILVGKKVFSCHTVVKLNSMYRVVVEFIEWLNTTKQPQQERDPVSQDVKPG